jgi:transcriptional regulator with XRE-family HTH domain
MPSNRGRLSPLIERLKAWRISNNLSQAQAVKILVAEGLPIALTTLQQWEIGRRSPQPVAVAALERFLARQEKSSLSRAQKAISPVIERLKAWREVNNLSQLQAVEVLRSAGLPAKVKTLQAWENGRNSPQPITAAALQQFLDQHPRITHPPSHRSPPPQSAVRRSSDNG